jgi:anaerobic magnesium-protoporphyrin IX monomethyl ester cyclase
MRVLLGYPFRKNMYYKVGFILPPLGLGYLASFLKLKGHEVDIIDFNISQNRIDLNEYDVVGISCDTARYLSALELAKQVRKTKAKIVMGGPHVTFMDEEPLKNGLADYIVRGEGEETMAELLDSIEGKFAVDEVAGISFMHKSEIIRTPDRKAPDFSIIPPPDRKLLKIESYQWLEMGGRKITSLLTSRGCPYNCTFCSSSMFSGTTWRALSAEKVVDEIEDIVCNYGFDGIAFLDDNFTLNPKRVKNICREIIRRRLDTYWWCFSRADILLSNEDMVKEMAEAGARYIFIGFESSKEDTLKHYKKRITTEQSVEAVKLLKSHGISTHASFIIGDITETKGMALDTIRFARELSPDAVQFSILTPYPGTQLFKEVKERIFTYNWNLYDCLHPVFRLDYLRPEDLQKLLKKAYINFYLSPKRIMNGFLSPLKKSGIKISSILRIMRGLN